MSKMVGMKCSSSPFINKLAGTKLNKKLTGRLNKEKERREKLPIEEMKDQYY